ncbi:nitrate reductase [Paremcibacter congregatus]|uniref:Nitrate reductase n=1 Tax=Paremcibacter congregatus TaxID=2043170 RepID=A0A2G4YS80_9PROT|nr:nitrate reductase [Paremcibacter congregatus]PHZ85127.1 nitrate reductase [Paremcibacter congregatus]QDE27936.1 nitrate reductase [Paremcibacter congregatus]
MANPVKTTCPYCGVGCGVLATRTKEGKIQIAGDPEHPANFGKLCSKGGALAETLDLEDRLLLPEVSCQKVGWSAALQAAADGLSAVREEHGPDAIGFYVSGQLLTEDYYVANKLMKGFIGSGNIDTNSRLCMSSSVAGHKRAFGSDTVPGNYEDWDQADLVVLVGSNAAWCHPILFQRLRHARETRGAKLVVIDPRRTASCDSADLHLALKPGTDVRLFNGLLAHLAAQDCQDSNFVARHTHGMADALASARADAPDIAHLAQACGLSLKDITAFFDLFATTEKTLTVYSQGVNQSSQGTDKVNAILNCHLYTGRIGRPGMGPFSITGQPNAMGGREVGGLANTLAAHMEFDDVSRDRLSRFWDTKTVASAPGLKAIDMFRAVHEGKIRAIWIMGTNPAASLPDATFVRDALEKCDLVIVSDVMENTDTLKYAHIAFPARAWGEKDGTVTNSERRISRQRAFLPAPGDARPDWWIISQVARRMGFAEAFPYETPADIFREHAALSALENDGRRDFDLSGLKDMDTDSYDALAPVQWPVSPAHPTGRKRLFDDGYFFTDDQRARLIAVSCRPPVHTPDKAYPLILNSGRLRDQWHTMTRTGKASRLNAHQDEPALALHPLDAELYDLGANGFAKVSSRWGTLLVRVQITPDQTPGQVFLPIHWTDSHAARAVTGCLVNPATDPLSGQPELKHTPVKVEKWNPDWHAFLLTRHKIMPEGVDYWSYSRQDSCHALELAGQGRLAGSDFLRPYLDLHQDPDTLNFSNPLSGQKRLALIRKDQLALCLFTAHKGTLPDRNWLQSLFSLDKLEEKLVATLLSGQPLDPQAAPGPIICACFGVSKKEILTARREKRALTVNDISHLLKAGSNCGSCRPEIKQLMTGS